VLVATYEEDEIASDGGRLTGLSVEVLTLGS
jgi:hypothetical protein